MIPRRKVRGRTGNAEQQRGMMQKSEHIAGRRRRSSGQADEAFRAAAPVNLIVLFGSRNTGGKMQQPGLVAIVNK